MDLGMAASEDLEHRQWLHNALDRYERELVPYAQLITGNLESAREVVQETFLRLCGQNRAEVDGRLRQWLFRVCRNAALDTRRRDVREVRLRHRVESSGPRDPPPDETAERRDTAGRVLRFLAELPDNQQEVLRLKLLHGLKSPEICEITGLSPSNVRFLAYVGLKRLRERMGLCAGAED